MCYNSRIQDKDEVKLVRMMGSSLMIVMYQNNEIQNREINTARRLKIPILFIYNSEEDKIDHKVKKGENKIVFKNLEEIEMILRKRFKLFKKLKERNNLPFKSLEKTTKLFEFNELSSISILKEKKKLLLAGDTIQVLDLHSNTLEPMQTFQFNEGQLNVCVNNKDKEIIILNNRVFYKYNFDFVKISEDKILELDSNVIINEIVVNEENKHVYGISNNLGKLYHFDEEFKLIETMKITIPLLIKVLNNKLYMLYGNTNIEGRDTSEIIENKKSFIGVYSQKEKELVKFKRKIVLDVLVVPRDFHVDENYIFIFCRYINKHHIFDWKNLRLFLFNHKGKLLQKTEFDFWSNMGTEFLVDDYQTIYCADYYFQTINKLEYSRFQV